MSRLLERLPDGTYRETLHSEDECRYLINEVCCNGDCRWMVAEFPDEEDCKRCRYFEKEEPWKILN